MTKGGSDNRNDGCCDDRGVSRADLLAAWEQITSGPFPDGVQSSLTHAEGGGWRVHTVWESREALASMRASTDTPAALAMFEAAGAVPAVTVWDVVRYVRP